MPVIVDWGILYPCFLIGVSFSVTFTYFCSPYTRDAIHAIKRNITEGLPVDDDCQSYGRYI